MHQNRTSPFAGANLEALVGSGKTDPVRFNSGLKKRTFQIEETNLTICLANFLSRQSYMAYYYMPEKRKAAYTTPILHARRPLFQIPF